MRNYYFYRPEWTCGRYNRSKEVAIYYNLIEGISYFYEGHSAMVVGQILAVQRNGGIDVEGVSAATGISSDSIRGFFLRMVGKGLLATEIPQREKIELYRKRVGEFHRNSSVRIQPATKEKLPVAINTAESEYTNRVGGVTSVMFELTYNCSEKCVHCYNVGATRNDEEISHRNIGGELTIGDYRRIIDELYDEGVVKVCLSGGDPFSKPIAWDVIEYLYRKDIAFDIFTNGQMLVRNAKRLAGYYPRLVGISIYSGDPAIHDSITRVKGSWDKSLSVVRQLSELGVSMELKCCIMRPNAKTYRGVGEIAREYGAVAQFEVNVTDSVDGDRCVSKYLRLDEGALQVVLRDDNIPLYVGREAPNYGGQPKLMDENACGAGYNSFCITPDGWLIPCCAYHLNFDNLRKQSLREVLGSKTLKWWRGLTLRQYEECGKHDYCDYCNLCAGNNYSEFGTPLKASENNCFMARARFHLASRLMQGDDPLHGQSIQMCLDKTKIKMPASIRRVSQDELQNKG